MPEPPTHGGLPTVWLYAEMHSRLPWMHFNVLKDCTENFYYDFSDEERAYIQAAELKNNPTGTL